MKSLNVWFRSMLRYLVVDKGCDADRVCDVYEISPAQLGRIVNSHALPDYSPMLPYTHPDDLAKFNKLGIK
jgi:hypothetical protein